jgi:hypothetical protein
MLKFHDKFCAPQRKPSPHSARAGRGQARLRPIRASKFSQLDVKHSLNCSMRELSGRR